MQGTALTLWPSLQVAMEPFLPLLLFLIPPTCQARLWKRKWEHLEGTVGSELTPAACLEEVAAGEPDPHPGGHQGVGV